ncbi:MAG TPA: tetratricopeptide repeat protein [Terriglobia bacterium]|nr:tetratricopeptide repeat protein [Terriglobia bacterium]
MKHTPCSRLLGQRGKRPVGKILAGLLWAVIASGLNTSSGQTAEPQANSPAEFDAYLNILAKTTPEGVISATEMFERNWPHSELCGKVNEMEMEAFRSLNNATGAIRAGAKALAVNPDNPAVLASLAYILADSFSDSQHLAQAERDARKEIEISEKLHIPRWILPNEWDRNRSAIDSEAHAALGLIAYKQGNIRKAIQEFEMAIKMNPSPDPAQDYRLGVLYQAAGNKVKAIQELRLAANSKDTAIRMRAQRELKALQH